MSDLTEEVLLEFKRFAPEKQDQIRQLVSYATLMGLSGKDLISIGGKLDRVKERQQHEALVRIAEGYEAETKPVGRSKQEQESNRWHKWRYVDANGVAWRFNTSSRWGCEVTNESTGKTKRFSLEEYFPKSRSSSKIYKFNALLNLHHGKIMLNF